MDTQEFNKAIPTWDNGIWTETIFTDRNEFIEFVHSVFKEPGQYDLDNTSEIFNEQARLFRQNGYYCNHPFKTKDFIKYWDFEKQKCVNGVIYKHEDKTWYLPREYYMWINFLPIYDKMKKDFDFPLVWDVQIHMSLYECLAELHYKHAVITKKRQIASSYFHAAKLLNKFWFDAGAILKIGASLKKYVNLEGTWKYLEEYKNFLNTNTAWYRPLNPSKEGNWQQKIEVNQGGRIYTKGLKSTLLMTSFEKSETSSVGGPCSYFFHEEAGIAPKMDKTYIYLKSALEMGDMTTGQFIAAGSVGELKDCEPLKDFMLNPEANGFFGVETDLADDNGSRAIRGLFIPEQWGMPPYIDRHGNSMVDDALKALEERFNKLKKEKDPASYQLEISQHPRNLKEAFAYRDISIFPTNIIEDQLRRIEEKEYPYELVDLKEKADGTIIVKNTNISPIQQWPIKKDLEHKEGSIQVWERPDQNILFNEYIASIDPVKAGKSTTSDSLNSIYVYKMPIRINRTNSIGKEHYVEGGKIVCCWCGRFDNPDDNHERLALILKWYKCRAVVEANVTDFINYMINKNLAQKHLVRKSEIVFLKEYNLNTQSFQDYGWKNTNTMFKDIMLPMLINWLNEVIDEDFNDNGESIKKYFGVMRIPDKMACIEMLGYTPQKNVDRLIALTALICFLKAQEANHLTPVRYETDNLEKNKEMYKLKVSPFSRIGMGNNDGQKIIKSHFSKNRW